MNVDVDEPGKARGRASTAGRRRRRRARRSPWRRPYRPVDMQVFTCIIGDVAARWTRSSRRWPTRPGGCCSTGCTSATGRRWASCASTLDMARQSATQHLGVLEAANLVSTRPARAGEAALPQPRAAPRDPGALDRQVRAAAAARAQRDETPAEEQAMTDTADLRLRHLHRGTPGAGLAGADRRRPHRRVLGPQQRLRLAAGLDAGSTGAPTARASPTSSAPCSRRCRRRGW